MSDYIRREDAKKVISDIAYILPSSHPADKHLDTAYVKIKTLPSADVVEVVRCKDCRHINECGVLEKLGVADDWFCADGERRADE